MRKSLKIATGLCAVAAVCFWLGMLREQKAAEPEPEIVRPVRTVTLGGGSGEGVRRYFGTLQGGRRVDLSFRVSGPLKEIAVEKGASVKRGDLLATLDPRDFQTRLKQAQSAQAQAQAQYSDAQTNFTRYENLYNQRAISKAQYDASKTQVDVTRSAVSTAAAQTAAARDALRDTELRAPFDGIIADRMVENFQDITAKQPVFSLQDISTLEIVFNIPDNDILLAPIPAGANLKMLVEGDGTLFTLTARFDAMPDRAFPLKVKEFAAQADPRTNTYPVTATMPRQRDVNFLPGMAVTVEVDFRPDGNAQTAGKYFVPATAILNEGTPENYLWRLAKGVVSRVPVTVGGPRNDGALEVSGPDLHDGDVIITAGVHFLREGQKVRPQ
ncbi:MAG: efflux RND transporter periplasmic adaptor subunit [Fretibacterium sp.]|nr:efflux RND transporter periplasmic adaptor subunit [Fretibacterium sp.]